MGEAKKEICRLNERYEGPEGGLHELLSRKRLNINWGQPLAKQKLSFHIKMRVEDPPEKTLMHKSLNNTRIKATRRNKREGNTFSSQSRNFSKHSEFIIHNYDFKTSRKVKLIEQSNVYLDSKNNGRYC